MSDMMVELYDYMRVCVEEEYNEEEYAFMQSEEYTVGKDNDDINKRK